MTGQSEIIDRSEILIPDRQSAELAAAARAGNPGAVGAIPLEYVHETLEFHPEWVVDKISPRPGHYEVYTGQAFLEVMAPTLAWFREHLPAR